MGIPAYNDRSSLRGLLPHQGSMFLIERIAHFDRSGIECLTSTHRDPHNPLRDASGLPVHAAIEYAAQAAGLHGGLLNRAVNPEAPPQQGYLAVISQLHWSVERLDDLPGPLRIRARRTAVTAGGRAYHVDVDHADSPILSGDLVIALMEPAAV
jgi:predicted hotdog family 3-hydroxylacyl-ACP dehydratase